MSESWTWTYADTSGAPLTGEALTTAGFPSQSDAESWLGESWQGLVDEGVAAVTLRCGDMDVYGPMSLAPAD